MAPVYYCILGQCGWTNCLDHRQIFPSFSSLTEGQAHPRLCGASCLSSILWRTGMRKKSFPEKRWEGEPVGAGSNCQVCFFLPCSLHLSSGLAGLYKLVASSNTLLAWAGMYPRRLHCFPFARQLSFPRRGCWDFGGLLHFDTFQSSSPPPLTEGLLFARHCHFAALCRAARSVSS